MKYRQNLVAVLDSLQVCAFSSYAFSLEDYARELNNVTTDELLEIGERVFSIEREFNLEHGFSSSDDTLPERFLGEPLPNGVHRGKVCELEPMLSEYRKMRGHTFQPKLIQALPSLLL